MSGVSDKLSLVRFELDVIDDQIADLLAARFRRLERVAAIKAAEKLPAFDAAREEAIVLRLERRLADSGAVERLEAVYIFRSVLEAGRRFVDARLVEQARHDVGDEPVDSRSGRTDRDDGPPRRSSR